MQVYKAIMDRTSPVAVKVYHTATTSRSLHQAGPGTFLREVDLLRNCRHRNGTSSSHVRLLHVRQTELSGSHKWCAWPSKVYANEIVFLIWITNSYIIRSTG